MSDDIVQKLVEQLEAEMYAAIAGQPQKQRQTALRVRGRMFETVEIDDAGNIIEPPRPCCYGAVIHAPNCKSWGT